MSLHIVLCQNEYPFVSFCLEHPPIQKVIDAGVIPRFVHFLEMSDFPQLQYEAAWALTNIVSSNDSDHTRVVIDAGAVPIFIRLLMSPHEDNLEQAVWALGNIAGGDAAEYRDVVLSHGVLPALFQLLGSVSFQNIGFLLYLFPFVLISNYFDFFCFIEFS